MVPGSAVLAPSVALDDLALVLVVLDDRVLALVASDDRALELAELVASDMLRRRLVISAHLRSESTSITGAFTAVHGESVIRAHGTPPDGRPELSGEHARGAWRHRIAVMLSNRRCTMTTGIT